MEERKFSEQELVRREKLQELIDKELIHLDKNLMQQHILKKLKKNMVIKHMKN